MQLYIIYKIPSPVCSGWRRHGLAAEFRAFSKGLTSGSCELYLRYFICLYIYSISHSYFKTLTISWCRCSQYGFNEVSTKCTKKKNLLRMKMKREEFQHYIIFFLFFISPALNWLFLLLNCDSLLKNNGIMIIFFFFLHEIVGKKKSVETLWLSIF